PGLRLPQPVGPAVRGRARPRLPADQHPARRGRGRAAGPHLPPARRPPPLRLPRGGRAGRPLHRGVPAGDGVRVRARGRALRPGALPPRRGGPPVARARRGDAAHLRAAPPPHHVSALRRLRAEDPAHAAGEGGPRGRGLGAAASQLLLLARGMTARHVVVVGGGFAGLAAAVRLARAGTRLFAGALRLAARGSALAGRTVAEALADVGQSRAACERFWHPLAIATLNEAPEIAAAAPFAAVLRRAFFAGARAARFALAAVPLSELYTSDAR